MYLVKSSPERGQYAPVIGIFLRQLAAGEPLTIVGDGEQRRDFVNVKDVCRANIMAAISNPDDDAYGQVYNVGSGKNYSVNEIASLILMIQLIYHQELERQETVWQI